MNVELLVKMVRDLILDRDEVGLPGLGVFVAEFEPAGFSDRGYILNPPYRRLRFEQKTSVDDSLVNAYATGNGISRQKSCELLEKYISGLKETVEREGTLTLPGLGKFCAGREGRILFIRDEDTDISYDGIRLEPISLKAHIEEPALEDVSEKIPGTCNREPAETAQPQQQEQPNLVPLQPLKPVEAEVPTPTIPRRRICWWRFPLAILILAVVGLAVFVTLAQVAPDFIDSILYTPEELLIINS